MGKEKKDLANMTDEEIDAFDGDEYLRRIAEGEEE